ncbi:MAG: 1-deoxy-D-xylulose-5-phosphate reductoisomerase [Candidatus Omnitrophica bacterium]|nr:1-deoxy-D-xylulose-5-phosphate reductoisomerase [Candidatus Omnitrophota bacterium]
MIPPRRIAILGSTGSIGQNTLNVIRAFPGQFKVTALAAGNNVEEFKRQVDEWRPDWVCLAEKSSVEKILPALPSSVKALAGEQGMIEIVQRKEVDLVVFATTGTWGVAPLLAAIQAKKQVALANKESLVMAGRIVTDAARENGVKIIPIDSEHSAIFQILNGQDPKELHRIFLTCSGGPLLHVAKEQLKEVTLEQALKHPRWKMGRKITIDSSTLMNKGLEIIEAKWLFGVTPDQVQVVIHPEAVVHSMVEYRDGSFMAQMGVTDMKGPIQYALGYPHRLPAVTERLNLVEVGKLSFSLPDVDRFPCLRIAYQAARGGDSDATVMNGANDTAVEAFLEEKIRWNEIPELIETVLSRHQKCENPGLARILELDRWAREETTRLIGQRSKAWVS